MAAPCITLDPTLAAPTYQQIVARLREAMNTGVLTPGARLPSARSLASQLGVARGTVDAAYAVLAGEGTIETRGAAGSVVSPHLAPRRPRAPPVRRCRSAWDCRRWTPSLASYGPG